MVRTLYGRLLVTLSLLFAMGLFLFWLFNIQLSLNDPLSVMLSAAISLLVGAVVLGVILHPVDQMHAAIRHVAAGEDVPLPAGRGDDLKALAAAIGTLRARAERPMPNALADVLNALSEGVLLVDTELNPVHVNTALRSLANTAEAATAAGSEAYRRLFHDRCFVPDQLALIEEQMLKAPDQPRTDIIRLESPQQYLKRYAAPMHNDRGDRTGFVISYQDITREMLQEQARGEFIANASHELRTPVTSVKVLLENLQDGAKEDPSVRDEFLDDMTREIDRMHELVNDLLDISALESGRNTLKYGTFEIAKVVAEAVETVAPQAKQRDVAIEPDLCADLSLEADVGRMRQVLVNLVANAVKFTPNGGRVTVKTWREQEQVRVAISDTGIGIPPADLPHIFDRFYRVTKGRSRLQGGSGLGLTIVKQAIDAHRGEIVVESTIGQGTTFTITLPLRKAEA